MHMQQLATMQVKPNRCHGVRDGARQDRLNAPTCAIQQKEERTQVLQT